MVREAEQGVRILGAMDYEPEPLDISDFVLMDHVNERHPGIAAQVPTEGISFADLDYAHIEVHSTGIHWHDHTHNENICGT